MATLPLAIRSSAVGEDDLANSLAGEYSSVLNVSTRDHNKVSDSIDIVIDSYKYKLMHFVILLAFILDLNN